MLHPTPPTNPHESIAAAHQLAAALASATYVSPAISVRICNIRVSNESRAAARRLAAALAAQLRDLPAHRERDGGHARENGADGGGKHCCLRRGQACALPGETLMGLGALGRLSRSRVRGLSVPTNKR